MEIIIKRLDIGQDYTAISNWSLINPSVACLFLHEYYNNLQFEMQNP